MSFVVEGLLILPLVGLVLWLAQSGFRRMVQPHTAGMSAGSMLLMLFAWSFVLGAVMRWIQL